MLRRLLTHTHPIYLLDLSTRWVKVATNTSGMLNPRDQPSLHCQSRRIVPARLRTFDYGSGDKRCKVSLQENSYAKHLHATLPDARGESSINPRQSSERGIAIEELAQLQQHLLLFKRKPCRRDQGKPPMMHAYVEG
jgi:hypothetical protein